MARVVRAICARSQWGQIVPRFDDVDTTRGDAATIIGRRLFAMNVEAVMQRYPDTRTNPDDMPGPVADDGKSTALSLAETFSSDDGGARLSRKQLIVCYKSIGCLDYQCSEGDVMETPLFKELERAAGRVAHAIVAMLPEYEAAPWD